LENTTRTDLKQVFEPWLKGLIPGKTMQRYENPVDIKDYFITAKILFQ
jgi:hypothetical protein